MILFHWSRLLDIHLEDISGRRGMRTRHVDERRRSDVVSLTFAHWAAVLQEILNLQLVTLGLRSQHLQ